MNRFHAVLGIVQVLTAVVFATFAFAVGIAPILFILYLLRGF